jgi:periplasmic copper chaperone A
MAWCGATRAAAAVMVAGMAAVAAACGSASGAGSVSARQGDIEVVNPYVPAPASPSVAAMYLTVRDVGPTADTLQGGTTAVAGTTALMTETADSMAPLASVPVPAHGQAVLQPGHSHLMLQNLNGTLHSGQTITVDLHFAQTGTVAVRVPVIRMSASMPGM